MTVKLQQIPITTATPPKEQLSPRAIPAVDMTVSHARHIHLLYVPTLFCNLNCSYCYLGEQTSIADLRQDNQQAVSTLQYALEKLADENILAFNVSLHGGEVTALPSPTLNALFSMIRSHYLNNFDALTALGYRKSVPHIKTNLYKFASLYDLFDRHKVSVSASIDLPLALHHQHRVTRSGKAWKQRTEDNLRLLANYPHAKKISATLSATHLADIDAIIDDIWFIHRELGFDMNQMNLMFAFESALNDECGDKVALAPCSEAQQLALYDALHQVFADTELAEGLHRNWFDEFKPSYCTNAFNCGERFYLLQSDGNVYSCVRGQGIPEFHYGNIFTDNITDILHNGARKISTVHQQFGVDDDCRACNHLSQCNTGCPVVKYQRQQPKSYTCQLQHRLYSDNPLTYPPSDEKKQTQYEQHYLRRMHPTLYERDYGSTVTGSALKKNDFLLPNDLVDDKNTLMTMIDGDAVLQTLYSDKAFVLQLNDERIPLASQLLKGDRTWHIITSDDRIGLHIRRDVMTAASPEVIRNTLYLQMLSDSQIVYGDEQRQKQAHLFTYQLWYDYLQNRDDGEGEAFLDGYYFVDISRIIHSHSELYQRNVLNNLFFTTSHLRDYHYLKQKNNAFYHIQAINLPFQNVEFYYLLQ